MREKHSLQVVLSANSLRHTEHPRCVILVDVAVEEDPISGAFFVTTQMWDKTSIGIDIRDEARCIQKLVSGNHLAYLAIIYVVLHFNCEEQANKKLLGDN
jgi:hypothetical protein